MNDNKNSNCVQGAKIIASSILLSGGVLGGTLALLAQGKGIAIIPFIMAGIGLWLMISASTNFSLISYIVKQWKYSGA